MFRPVNISRYLVLMQARGFGAAEVLAGTGIDSASLQTPDYLVDSRQCQRVIANMIRLTGDPALGLSFGSAIRIADLGIVGHALLSSRSIRQALQLWAQYSRCLLDTLLSFRLEARGNGAWTLSLGESVIADPAVYRFCTEEQLAIGQRLGSILAGEPMQVASLQLDFSAGPGDEERYRSLFRCEPLFNASRTAITMLTPKLDQPLRHNPDELGEVCLRHCSRIMRELADGASILSRLRGILLRNTDKPPSIVEAAKALDMSERTLRRRLAEQGTSYQDFLSEFRRDLAIEYLRSEQMLVKEVGYLLGFKTPGSFRRAFKEWTGSTVSEFLAKEHSRAAHPES